MKRRRGAHGSNEKGHYAIQEVVTVVNNHYKKKHRNEWA